MFSILQYCYKPYFKRAVKKAPVSRFLKKILIHFHLQFNCQKTTNSFYFYFTATTATTLDHLGKSIPSDFEGNPPLYISRRRKNNHEDIWINNAMIIRSRSNVQMQNEEGKKQVCCYVIMRDFFMEYHFLVSFGKGVISILELRTFEPRI